jgi:hypothetical protein
VSGWYPNDSYRKGKGYHTVYQHYWIENSSSSLSSITTSSSSSSSSDGILTHWCLVKMSIGRWLGSKCTCLARFSSFVALNLCYRCVSPWVFCDASRFLRSSEQHIAESCINIIKIFLAPSHRVPLIFLKWTNCLYGFCCCTVWLKLYYVKWSQH